MAGVTTTWEVVKVDEETVYWLLEGEAESQETRLPGDFGTTPRTMSALVDLDNVLSEYGDAVEQALTQFVTKRTRWSQDRVTEFVEVLMTDGQAPFIVLMTLRGEGIGIWDGRWDEYFDERGIKQLQETLPRELGRFADATGGGSVNDALSQAVFSAGEVSPNPYGPVRPEETDIRPGDHVEIVGAGATRRVEGYVSEANWYPHLGWVLVLEEAVCDGYECGEIEWSERTDGGDVNVLELWQGVA